MKYGIVAHLGKFNYRCGMCHNVEYNEKYKWRGYVTNTELTLCAKCAEREGGKKIWKKRSLQLKKLSQK